MRFVRLQLLSAFWLGTLCASAQVEIPRDSITLPKVDSLSVNPITSPLSSESNSSTYGTWHPSNIPVSTLNDMPTSNMQLDFSLPHDVAHWKNGILVGNNGINIYNGLGATRFASAMTYQHIGNLTLAGGLSLEKMNYGRYNANTIRGSLSASYRLNDNISATAFGSVGNVGFFGQNSMNTYNMGGYFSFTTNNRHWGIDLGAQRYFDPYTRQWRTQPIAMPYYKFNNGQKLGIDVGGLLYNLFLNGNESMSPHTVKPMPHMASPTAPRPHKW